MAENKSDIYFFIPFYPETTTGGNKYHSIVYENLKALNERVYVFGNEKNMIYVEKSVIKKIIYGFKKSLEIPRKSTIILTNTAFLHFLFPYLSVNIFKRHKYILIVHHLLRDQESKFLVKLFEGLFIKLIGNVITVSQSTKARLKHFNYIKEDIPVINPGLNLNTTYDFRKRQIKDIVKFLFVGTIEKRKALNTIIEALHGLKDIDYRLSVIGNPVDNAYYKDILSTIDNYGINDKITFLKNISYQDLTEFYRESDILLFPSTAEGYGMVIAEAMINGLPVIASKIPTSEELISDGENGLLFETNNISQLQSCIKKLVEDNALLNKISENSIKKSQTFKSWEKTSLDLLKIIKGL